MAERIVPEASLTAVASPVDRFVAPLQKQVKEDSALQLAKALQQINPSLQKFLAMRQADYVATEEAKGANAENYIDPSVKLEENRKSWKDMVDQQRGIDRQNGTSYADKIAAASPHFQRGMLKARAQRMGMAVGDHLSSLYARNPEVEINGQMVNLHDVDDAMVLSRWAQQEAASFTERMGLTNIDPVLLNDVYTPLVQRAEAELMRIHTNKRLDLYSQQYSDELSANMGMILNGGMPVGDGYNAAGMDAAAKTAMENLESIIGQKLKVTSAYRSPEHNAKVGGAKNSQHTHGKAFDVDVSGMSIAQRQQLIRQARQAGFSGIGVYKNSLHFDVGGDRHWGPSYLKESTPEWALEALNEPVGDLVVEANRFTAANIQVMMDQAIADGMYAPLVNKNAVATVTLEAIAKRDPSILGVLMELDTGSGPLGKIGWVKAEVASAQSQIQSAIIAEENRRHTLETRQREEAKRGVMTDAYTALINDPTVDIGSYVAAAMKTGNPELARSINEFQQSLLDQSVKRRTDPDVFTELRYRIGSTYDPNELDALMDDISAASRVSLLDVSAVGQLFDDIMQQRRNGSVLRNPLVLDYRDNLQKSIRDRFAVNYGPMIRDGGYDQEQKASVLFDLKMREFLRVNEGATEAAVVDAAASIVEEIKSRPEFAAVDPFAPAGETAPQNAGQGTDTAVDVTKQTINLTPKMKQRLQSDPDLLSDMAEQNGMSVAEYIAKAGIFDN